MITIEEMIQRGMFETKLYTYIRNGLRFTWNGGAYIEVAFQQNAIPYDVINVYDYELGKPRIEVSLQSLVDFIDAEMEQDAEWECY